MICLTSLNVSGLLPIKEVSSFERRPVFMVNSAGAGHIPIDVSEQNIDILTFTGHKGLFGPQGTGGFYLRPGLEIRSLIEGGTGSSSDKTVQPSFLPDKFESGTPNTPGIAGLGEGVNFILKTGLAAIQRHERKLMDMMIEGLKHPGSLYLILLTERQTSVLSIDKEQIVNSFLLDEKIWHYHTSGSCT